MPRKVRQVYTNFSAGELNSNLNARTDARAYFEGAKQCRNWFLLDEGGVMRRPATQFTNTLVGETVQMSFISTLSAGSPVVSEITAKWTGSNIFVDANVGKR